jgi:ABC-2 type transport system ATP-binding protein
MKQFGSTSGAPVKVTDLSKRFGSRVAVDSLTFEVHAGRVTGFLGPNGAGKTTTLRCLLGLAAPTSGSVTISDCRYEDLSEPTKLVGAALDSNCFHPGRSARQHLMVMATAAAIPFDRVDDVLKLVALADSAGRRVGEFSLGMRQRLSLAAALLGDPAVLLLDEPLNGLDPEGIRWMRDFLRFLATEGRTVFLSSHLLSEISHTVDDVVVIARGALVAAAPLTELVGATAIVEARTPDAELLCQILTKEGIKCEVVGHDTVIVRGVEPDVVGRAAAGAGVVVLELARQDNDLERLFFGLVGDNQEMN